MVFIKYLYTILAKTDVILTVLLEKKPLLYTCVHLFIEGNYVFGKIHVYKYCDKGKNM